MRERSIDRELAGDLIALLRLSGLLKGGAQTEQRSVIVPVMVRAGTTAEDVAEALAADHVSLQPKIKAALLDGLVLRENGHVVLRLRFATKMAAIHIQAVANYSRA